jgi:hypothetical protein
MNETPTHYQMLFPEPGKERHRPASAGSSEQSQPNQAMERLNFLA